MANDPCIDSSDSVALSLVGTPHGLHADLRRSPIRGNPLVVYDAASGLRGVDGTDAWASDQGGVGVNDSDHFFVGPPTVASLAVSVSVSGPDFVSRAPLIRLPGAGGDPQRFASLPWPDVDLSRDVQLPVADVTNPRIDRIVATWSSDGQSVTFVVKPGTATAGATPDNLLGATAVDENQEVRLADVLVDAGALVISSFAKIRDRRPFTLDAGVPPKSAAVKSTIASLGFVAADEAGLAINASMINRQSAVLVRLDRAIRANFLYLTYAQTTAGQSLTGSFAVGIYDASKRLKLQTGAQTLAGTGTDTNVLQRVRAAFTASNTLLPPGYYYVCLGVTSLAGTGTIGIRGTGYGLTPLTMGPRLPNVFWHRDSGGVNMVNTLDLAAIPFSDAYNDVTATSGTPTVVPVPVVHIGEN